MWQGPTAGAQLRVGWIRLRYAARHRGHKGHRAAGTPLWSAHPDQRRRAVLHLLCPHHQFQVADLPALLATSIPSLLNALVGIVRWRRIDLQAGFVLFTISLAVALVTLGGDPRLYLIRESFITAGRPGLGPRSRGADVSRFHLEHRAISDRVAHRVLRFLRGTARLVRNVGPTQTPGIHARPGSSRPRQFGSHADAES